MTIVLIGYMASGKSSIGKRLAKKLNYNFIDLDDFIEEKENMSVTQIFKNKGEVYFRNQEARYLKDLLNNNANTILAVGGGTPCYSGNMECILSTKDVRSVYLKASLSALAKKLMEKKAKRPLIAHIDTLEEMTEFIGKHLFERMPFYEQAQTHISIDGKTKDEVTNELASKLL